MYWSCRGISSCRQERQTGHVLIPYLEMQGEAEEQGECRRTWQACGAGLPDSPRSHRGHAHLAAQSLKATQWSGGGTRLRKKRQGLGNRALGNQPERSFKKNKTEGKAKNSPSAPPKMSQAPQSHMSRVGGGSLTRQPPSWRSSGRFQQALAQHLTQPANTPPCPPPHVGGQREGQQHQRGHQYSPSVPSGSRAQEVRAASRPAGTGRRTSPGSWRQGGQSPRGMERSSYRCSPSTGWGGGKGQAV